jgi:crotonobetainyl-CoA:carnitine CoA-transferase CaiB-like acyl-CoA transferase
VVITCPSQKFFVKLCEALETNWVDDARFATIDARKANEQALDTAVEARCMDFGREELVERLIAGDILTAPINDISQVVNDPQILHNEMIVSTEHEKLGSVDVTGVPIKFHGTPGRVRLAPPILGQHTEVVLAELGYEAGEIERLAEAGIVGTRARIEAAKAR